MKPDEIKSLVKETVLQVLKECNSVDSWKSEPLTGANKKFGYRFGCDGLMSSEEACEFLGGVHRHTLTRKAAEDLIRKGRHANGGKVVYCRRSIAEYVERMEL